MTLTITFGTFKAKKSDGVVQYLIASDVNV
jgi:hypothetical protein